MCSDKSLDRQLSRKAEMKALKKNIKAFEKMRGKLEAEELRRWVVFHDQEFIGAFDSFHDAAVEAVRLFGRGPYLIRQVGAQPLRLPASILYRPVYT